MYKLKFFELRYSSPYGFFLNRTLTVVERPHLIFNTVSININNLMYFNVICCHVY